MSKRFHLWPVLFSLTFAACGKKPAESVAQPESAPTAATSAPVPIEGLVDNFMTAQLQIYIREQGRMPASYNEFATARMDSPPLAPEGMEFVIDTTTRQVKLVKIKP